MSENGRSFKNRYPRELTLEGGNVTLRLMEARDQDAVLSFVRELPPDDLLFLRLDVTAPEGLAEWVGNVQAGRTITVLAEQGGVIVGYASIHHNDTMWNRHIGEIRVNVGAEFRKKGLGRRLVEGVFAIARDIGLRKITAQMTPDQKGARVTFERLGFRPEALLADFVVDREGKTRDLLIMTQDLAGFTDVEYVSAAGARKSS
jgi:RimJ/RimL family protein N-acetyltransferase